MSKSNPTILIVPGSFTITSFYNTMVSHLKQAGFDTLVFNHPSSSRRPPQKSATMYEDAAFFNGVLATLCGAGKDVVVLGHSYGGTVATECVRGFTERASGRGRVLGLVYLTAGAPLVGQTMGELTADLGFDFIKVEGEYMYHEPLENSARTNFSDMPLEEGIELVKQMPWHSAQSFKNELTYAGYQDVDSAFILCSKDKCLNPDFQRRMIENIKNGGKTVEVYELEAGHCCNSSVPEKAAALVAEAVKAQFV